MLPVVINCGKFQIVKLDRSSSKFTTPETIFLGPHLFSLTNKFVGDTFFGGSNEPPYNTDYFTTLPCGQPYSLTLFPLGLSCFALNHNNLMIIGLSDNISVVKQCCTFPLDLTLFWLGGYQIYTCLPFSLY